MRALKTSGDARALHFEVFKTIPAKGKKPEHGVVKIKCTHFVKCFIFSTWVRGRAHLAGNPDIALGNSTAPLWNPGPFAGDRGAEVMGRHWGLINGQQEDEQRAKKFFKTAAGTYTDSGAMKKWLKRQGAFVKEWFWSLWKKFNAETVTTEG